MERRFETLQRLLNKEKCFKMICGAGNENAEQVNTDITVFNGSDTLCNYTTLSNMHYDSMYSKNGHDEHPL